MLLSPVLTLPDPFPINVLRRVSPPERISKGLVVPSLDSILRATEEGVICFTEILSSVPNQPSVGVNVRASVLVALTTWV